MRLEKCLLTTLLLLGFCLASLASPAKRGDLSLVQPDGTKLTVNIYGDEFGHVVRLKDGCAITVGPDGFYRYAVVSAEGRMASSEYLAGRKAPAAVRNRSKAVKLHSNRPVLSRRAAETRQLGRVLVIPVQFKDLELRNGVAQFESLLTRAQAYLNDQLEDRFPFSFVVSPVATLSRGYAFYGENDADGLDKRAKDAVQEAVNLVDDVIDFSLFDYIYLFYAGGSPADGSADDNHIWPHSAYDVRITTSEKVFDNYAMSSELMTNDKSGRTVFTGIGTFCHEYGHQLGLCDMYDSDYEKSGGMSNGLWWTTSIMDGGCYNDNSNTPPCFNAIELEQLGIVEAEELEIGEYRLEPLSVKKRFLRMDTDNPGEYFLFECRAKSGWDEFIGAAGGLLVYHIDRSHNMAGYSEYYERNLTAIQRWEYNEVNARADHSCAELITADPTVTAYVYDSERETYVLQLEKLLRIFFPSGTFNEYSETSGRPFKFWDGKLSPLSILNIARADNCSTFTVAGPIVLDSKSVFQDAMILNWHTDYDSFESIPATLTVEGPDGAQEYIVRPYEKGMFAYTIEGLQPMTNYTFTISYGGETDADSSMSGSFSTKAVNGMPFIYLQDTKRTITGYFTAESMIPLRVYNAVDAVSVDWYLNGKHIRAGKDGYYHLLSGGQLKAVVVYPDGSKDTIIKQISYK